MTRRDAKVSEIMRTELVTLAASETLDIGQDLMILARVRHMPVVGEDEKLVGLVSSRDLLEASLSKVLDADPAKRRAFLNTVEVASAMATDVATAGPDTTLEEAARTLLRRKIGCLPVVDPGGRLLGLVTETDLIEFAFLGESDSAAGAQRSEEEMKQSKFSEWVESELDDLRRVRDELRVQASLGKAEVRDEWQDLEQRLSSLERNAKRAAREAGRTLEELEQDGRQLARDLREGFRRIRDAL